MKGLMGFALGGILLALVFGFLLAGASSAGPGLAPCTVEEDGSGTHPTIQAAVDDAACDPINVGTGTFTETVDVGRSVTIQGQGWGQTAVDGGGTNRVFSIQSGAAVTLSGMTVRNGVADNGGGIHNSTGTLVVTGCVIRNNLANNHGGGLHNDAGELTVSDSTFGDNFAFDNGGGISNLGGLTVTSSTFSDNSGFEGGGISNEGALNVTDSTFSGNSASNGGGITSWGTMTVTDSSFIANLAGYGGGIYNQPGAILIVTNSTFGSNSTFFEGGGLLNHGTLNVTYSIFSDNSADEYGGGIGNQPGATLSVSQSNFRDNSATFSGGGGIDNYEGTLTVTASTFDGNSAPWGGGINNEAGGVLTVNSSTLSGNSATWGGGGIANYGTLSVTHSTLSANLAAQGGGVFVEGVYSATVQLLNTILANNPGGADCSVTTGGSITSQGYNLDSDDSCYLTEPTDQPGTDPLLGPLQDNGGATWTHALGSGSPALDAGSCPGLTADQRGLPRPVDLPDITNVDDGCDIGAFEFQAPTIYLAVTFKP